MHGLLILYTEVFSSFFETNVSFFQQFSYDDTNWSDLICDMNNQVKTVTSHSTLHFRLSLSLSSFSCHNYVFMQWMSLRVQPSRSSYTTPSKISKSALC
jgi:hypothetical protein